MVETRVSEMTTVWMEDNIIRTRCLQVAIMIYRSVGAVRTSAQKAPGYTISFDRSSICKMSNIPHLSSHVANISNRLRCSTLYRLETNSCLERLVAFAL